MMPKRARGRPFEGLTRSEDAATLFKALRVRGLTWDEARDAVQLTLGTSKSNLEKYLKPRVAFATADMEQINTRFVVAAYWDAMIAPKLARLDQKSRAALLELAEESESGSA